MPVTRVVRGGTVYDGTGAAGVRADVAIDGDRVVGVGEVPEHVDAEVVDATGLAVTPGFVNVLSHAWGSLQRDGSGASDLVQGVTTEVFGEAFSLGPSDDRFAAYVKAFAGDDDGDGVRLAFDHLGEGLDHLVSVGVAPNVASFIGGHNLRILAAGFDDRRLERAELDRLRGLVREEMSDGALGIGTALIYPPGRYADTDELVAVCEEVGRAGGVYISHLRSEGDQFLECLDELLEIGRRASCATEVYHLKAAGRPNHHKMALAIERIEKARADGVAVAANMYPYTAGATALVASVPPAYQDGGLELLRERLQDPALRRQIAADIRTPSDEFENLFLGADAGAGILFLDDLADGTRSAGRRLTEVAELLGVDDPAAALVEVLVRDQSIGVAYFMMSEANVELGLSQPWVSVGSDAEAIPPRSPFVDTPTHPRTYGTFARVLGHYSRDRGVLTFAEAVRRMSSLPADRFGLAGRGRLTAGSYADVVVLDPATVADRSTYEDPHRLAVGVRHVLVNGTPVVRDGAVTDARPGRRLRRGG